MGAPWGEALLQAHFAHIAPQAGSKYVAAEVYGARGWGGEALTNTASLRANTDTRCLPRVSFMSKQIAGNLMHPPPSVPILGWLVEDLDGKLGGPGLRRASFLPFPALLHSLKHETHQTGITYSISRIPPPRSSIHSFL